jgi:7-carboxy-7-deazaguanine synthase
LKIAEIFYSIQGEGALIGVPSVFIRTSGCNLRCSWCDTPYTSWHPEGSETAIDEIVAKTAEYSSARHVVLTGGEPMIAPGLAELSNRLRERGMHITIETAGTVAHNVACDLMSISPKLSNSTPQGPFRAQHDRLRIQPETLRRLMADYDYQLKFVIAQEADIDEMRGLLTELGAPAGRVVLMPEGIEAGTLNKRGVWLAEVAKRYGYRFSPRLHVLLWGNKRGT